MARAAASAAAAAAAGRREARLRACPCSLWNGPVDGCAARGAGLPGRPRSGSRRLGAAQVVASSRPGVYGSAVVGDMATVLSSAVSAHAVCKRIRGSACQGSGVIEK